MFAVNLDGKKVSQVGFSATYGDFFALDGFPLLNDFAYSTDRLSGLCINIPDSLNNILGSESE